MFDITSDSALGTPVSGRNCKTKPNKVSTQVSREKNHTEAVKQNKSSAEGGLCKDKFYLPWCMDSGRKRLGPPPFSVLYWLPFCLSVTQHER